MMSATNSVPKVNPDDNYRPVRRIRQEITEGKHEIWTDVVDQLKDGKTKNGLHIVAAFLVVAFNHDYTHWGLLQLPMTTENPLQTIADAYQEETTLDGFKPDGIPTFRKREPVLGMAPQQTVFPVVAVFIGTDSDGKSRNEAVALPPALLYMAQHGGPSYPEMVKSVRDFAFRTTEAFLVALAA